MFKISTRLVVSLLFACFVVGAGVGVISSQPSLVQAQMSLEDFVEQMSLGDFIRRLFEGWVGGGATPTPTPTVEPAPTVGPEPTAGRAPASPEGDDFCQPGDAEYQCVGQNTVQKRTCNTSTGEFGAWTNFSSCAGKCQGAYPLCMDVNAVTCTSANNYGCCASTEIETCELGCTSGACRAGRSCGNHSHGSTYCSGTVHYKCVDGEQQVQDYCGDSETCSDSDGCVANPVEPEPTEDPVEPEPTESPSPTEEPGPTEEPNPNPNSTPVPAGQAPACDPTQVSMTYSYSGDRVTFTVGGTQGSVHIGTEFPGQPTNRFTNCSDNAGTWPFIKTCTDTGNGNYFWKQTWKTCVDGNTSNCPNSCDNMIPVDRGQGSGGSACYYNVRLVSSNGALEDSTFQQGTVSNNLCVNPQGAGIARQGIPGSIWTTRPSGVNNEAWPCTGRQVEGGRQITLSVNQQSVSYVIGSVCETTRVPTGQKICVASQEVAYVYCANRDASILDEIGRGAVVVATPTLTPTPTPVISTFEQWKTKFLAYIRGGSTRTNLTELESWRTLQQPTPEWTPPPQ